MLRATIWVMGGMLRRTAQTYLEMGWGGQKKRVRGRGGTEWGWSKGRDGRRWACTRGVGAGYAWWPGVVVEPRDVPPPRREVTRRARGAPPRARPPRPRAEGPAWAREPCVWRRWPREDGSTRVHTHKHTKPQTHTHTHTLTHTHTHTHTSTRIRPPACLHVTFGQLITAHSGLEVARARHRHGGGATRAFVCAHTRLRSPEGTHVPTR